MSSVPIFGLEVVYKAHRSDISTSCDALVCAIHWCMLSDGLRCIGLGEIVPRDDNIEMSELLPSGWNLQGSEGIYSILYRHVSRNDKYMLKAIIVDDTMLINLVKFGSSDTVGSCNVFVDDFCSGDFSSYKQCYRNVNTLRSLLQDQVLKPVGIITVESNAATSSQASSAASRRTDDPMRNSRSDDPLRITPRQPVQPQQTWPQYRPDDPFSVGRADLDPLSGGFGGGMIFDPLRGGQTGFIPGMPPGPGMPGRLPPGAVPPGARFDPIFPESGRGRGQGPRSGPDPDHMRRPPDYDDMFM